MGVDTQYADAKVVGQAQARRIIDMANLIWNDPVKFSLLVTSECCLSACSVLPFVVGSGEHAASGVAESAVATVDHSDIRGSEPHNRDPSGAASD